MTIRRLNLTDRLIGNLQNAAQVLTQTNPSGRAYPIDDSDQDAKSSDTVLTKSERELSGALMRVNHVGEVCAQALYQGQALSAHESRVREQFEHAGAEERDHLAWTSRRLRELEARPSLLNPLWFAGSFALGALAGRAGDRASLGFMRETEYQVEQHLAGHLERLPVADWRSRQIVVQMKQDEAAHAASAQQLGGQPLPWAVRQAMKLAARFMTRVAHHV